MVRASLKKLPSKQFLYAFTSFLDSNKILFEVLMIDCYEAIVISKYLTFSRVHTLYTLML